MVLLMSMANFLRRPLLVTAAAETLPKAVRARQLGQRLPRPPVRRGIEPSWCPG